MANNENRAGTSASTTEAEINESEAKFETKKVYIKDVSFEAPSAPRIFGEKNVAPKYAIQIEITYRVLEDKLGLYDVNLKLTLTAKHEDNTLYLAEVQQAGIFQIQHPNPDLLQVIIEVTCPHLLLPFAREELNNLICKGGFTSFLVAPVNFESLYRAKKEKEEKEKPEAESSNKLN